MKIVTSIRLNMDIRYKLDELVSYYSFDDRSEIMRHFIIKEWDKMQDRKSKKFGYMSNLKEKENGK